MVKKFLLKERKYKKKKKDLKNWIDILLILKFDLRLFFFISILKGILNVFCGIYKWCLEDRLNKMFVICSCVYIYLDMIELFDLILKL